MKQSPIGILDSGFGGLTVMNAVKDLMPHENIIYFGDTANLPYGNKSAEAISSYCLKNTEFLLSLGIKLLIVACHTACTATYETVEKNLPIPIVGVVEPSISLLHMFSKKGKIALLGTRRTIQSGVYQGLIADKIPNCEITSIACPLFVPIVEEGYADHPIADSIVKEYLTPLEGKTIEALLLGCTHFPLLRKFIQKRMGPNTILIDPALACAKQAETILGEKNLLSDATRAPSYAFYVSDDPEKFRFFGRSFFHHPMEQVLSANLILS